MDPDESAADEPIDFCNLAFVRRIWLPASNLSLIAFIAAALAMLLFVFTISPKEEMLQAWRLQRSSPWLRGEARR